MQILPGDPTRFDHIIWRHLDRHNKYLRTVPPDIRFLGSGWCDRKDTAGWELLWYSKVELFSHICLAWPQVGSQWPEHFYPAFREHPYPLIIFGKGFSHTTLRNHFLTKTMFSKRLAPLTLLAFAAVAVPVHCSALKTLVKKDCIIALDGSCVDSIDFTASSNDFTTLPNDNLLAFNTLPTTTDPIDESFIFSDTDATNFGDLLGTQDLGDSSSLFFSDGGLGGFDGGFLIAGSKASCTCPHDIASDKVRKN